MTYCAGVEKSVDQMDGKCKRVKKCIWLHPDVSQLLKSECIASALNTMFVVSSIKQPVTVVERARVR